MRKDLRNQIEKEKGESNVPKMETVHETTNPTTESPVRFRSDGKVLLRQEHNGTRWQTTERHKLNKTQVNALRAAPSFVAWLDSHGPDLY